MTAAELLKAIEGVPEKALPTRFRVMLASGGTIYQEAAAIGAMLAWMTRESFIVRLHQTSQDGSHRVVVYGSGATVRHMHIETAFDAPTLIEALAAACRAVAKENAR